MTEKTAFLDEEIIIIRNSGEIPEVALHGALYYLSEDPGGPQLLLTEKDIAVLKSQVIARYEEIIRRDLEPENRDKSLYRGLKRCIANWHRLARFCGREGKNIEQTRKKTAAALLNFLQQETKDVLGGSRKTCVNCCVRELVDFAEELGVCDRDLPAGWQKIVAPGPQQK